jgi:hypothetical protein
MKIKTNELTDAALDWAVAKCEGITWTAYPGYTYQHGEGHYSTDWAQGGPIIEREGICVDLLLNGQWIAASRKVEGATMYCGPTPLIAAMRCYVASKLGDNIDIPDELH